MGWGGVVKCDRAQTLWKYFHNVQFLDSEVNNIKLVCTQHDILKLGTHHPRCLATYNLWIITLALLQKVVKGQYFRYP